MQITGIILHIYYILLSERKWFCLNAHTFRKSSFKVVTATLTAEKLNRVLEDQAMGKSLKTLFKVHLIRSFIQESGLKTSFILAVVMGRQIRRPGLVA
jgi:hypothetical protein